MLKKTTISIACLGLLMTVNANADTCKETNLGYAFRQVVMGVNGADSLRCDYGKEFDFEHSYTLSGQFKPVSGPWMGASDPFTVYCKSSYTNCVFKLEKK